MEPCKAPFQTELATKSVGGESHALRGHIHQRYKKKGLAEASPYSIYL